MSTRVSLWGISFSAEEVKELAVALETNTSLTSLT
jgi:hypothetical protein